MRTLIAYAAIVVVFAGVDLLWLGVVAKGYYRNQLGGLMAQSIKLGPALAFYLIYPIGVVFFCVLPAIETGNLRRAIELGAAFGFFAYATYDLTNWATLRKWPAQLTFIDIAWGTALTALAAFAGTVAGLKWAP